MAPVLDRCIRVSVGLDHELDIFAEELPGARRGAGLTSLHPMTSSTEMPVIDADMVLRLVRGTVPALGDCLSNPSFPAVGTTARSASATR